MTPPQGTEVDPADVQVGDWIEDEFGWRGPVVEVKSQLVYGPLNGEGLLRWLISRDTITAVRRPTPPITLIGPDGWEPAEGDVGLLNNGWLVGYDADGQLVRLYIDRGQTRVCGTGTIRALVVQGEPWVPPLPPEVTAVLDLVDSWVIDCAPDTCNGDRMKHHGNVKTVHDLRAAYPDRGWKR